MRWRASILPFVATGLLLGAAGLLRATGVPGATGLPGATGGSSASGSVALTSALANEPTVAPDAPATPEASAADDTQGPPKQLLTGRVVPLLDALKRRKISASEEELKGQVVLETPAGDLIPIVPDWRGRAFFQDERLRNRKVELVGYRPPGTPYLKVLMVFTFDEKGARQYTDYWCDICAIPMYEIQRCECCQGPIRLRFQPRELPEYLDEHGPAGRADRPDATQAGDSRRNETRETQPKKQPRVRP